MTNDSSCRVAPFIFVRPDRHCSSRYKDFFREVFERNSLTFELSVEFYLFFFFFKRVPKKLRVERRNTRNAQPVIVDMPILVYGDETRRETDGIFYI